VKDADAQALETALAAAGGAATLSDLRNSAAELAPEMILRTVTRWPERFAAVDTIRHGHATVLVSLEPELPAADKVFLNAVRGAGENGVARVRLWQKRSISAREADALANKYAEAVRVEVRERKTFFVWKNVNARAAEPHEKPNGESVNFERLVELIGSGHRHLSWLRQQYGLAVDTILAEHAERFSLEPVNLGETESTADMVVRLRSESDPVSVSALAEVSPSSGSQEPVRKVVGTAELEEMRWKPNSVGCSARRNRPVVAKNRGAAGKGFLDGGYGVRIRQ
jgi:hypothetical protein